MVSHFKITVTDPRRREYFLEVFSTDTVAVTSPVPILADLPGLTDPVHVYMLDMLTLDDDVRERLVVFLAEQFHLTWTEVLMNIDREGMPILAEDCVLTVKNPKKWFG